MKYRQAHDDVVKVRKKHVMERRSTGGSSVMASLAAQVAKQAQQKKMSVVSPKPQEEGKSAQTKTGM